MKLTTKMFLALVFTVAFLSALQYVLVRIEHGRIKGYAAFLGGSAPDLQAAGAGFLGGIVKSAGNSPASKAKSEQYSHENFYCTENVCSFTVVKKSLLMKPVTIVIDKNTLSADCLSPDGAKVSAGICRSLQDGGWDIIRAGK
ncbi:MAG: hypothetical protein LBL61_05445 [Elusimicrobiota bacterium]|nr:hypothetical protein [Elusimicrobiota bacterium]